MNRAQWTADYRRARLVRGFARDVHAEGGLAPASIRRGDGVPTRAFEAAGRVFGKPATIGDPLDYQLSSRLRWHRAGIRMPLGPVSPSRPASKEA